MDTMTVAAARLALVEQVQTDDSNTHCPLCKHRVRNDTKGLNRWMAAALRIVYDASFKQQVVHLGDLLKGTDGSRGHDAALLRHWKLIEPVARPEDASPKLKGSRGLSGFYKLTPLGAEFVQGTAKVPKNIVRLFGIDEYLMDGPFISYADACESVLTTTADGIVPNGSTVP
jgi:hypothetical protein